MTILSLDFCLFCLIAELRKRYPVPLILRMLFTFWDYVLTVRREDVGCRGSFWKGTDRSLDLGVSLELGSFGM